MSEEAGSPSPTTPPAATAGSLLKQARQAQGLHIAALAATMKVPQRKLEALEADRFDELPDATFTRALAQTVCRTLKIDPAPVLALLPRPAGHRLEHVAEGINAPFRERPGQAQSRDMSLLASPAMWAPLLLIVAAAVVYFLPAGLIQLPSSEPASSPASEVVPTPQAEPAEPVTQTGSEAVAPAGSSVVETIPTPIANEAPATAAVVPPGAVAAATPQAAAPAAPQATLPATEAAAPSVQAPADVAPPAASALQLRTSAESWIEVVDARGQTLLSRLVPGGETIALDGPTPLKVTIGNAAGTEVNFRGRPVDLAPSTARDNVARLTLR